jgi:hypothetical protein
VSITRKPAVEMAAFIAPVEDGPPYKAVAKPVTSEFLNGPGSLRVVHLMYLFDCSYSAVFRKIGKGYLPAPTGHDPRPWWSNEVIRKHLAGGAA